MKLLNGKISETLGEPEIIPTVQVDQHFGPGRGAQAQSYEAARQFRGRVYRDHATQAYERAAREGADQRLNQMSEVLRTIFANIRI
jgi:hypothetical protein